MIQHLKYRSGFIRSLIVVALFCLLAPAGSVSCKKKFRNYVDIEQINVDSSNNYRHIFKKTIEEERRKESRFRKNEFKD